MRLRLLSLLVWGGLLLASCPAGCRRPPRPGELPPAQVRALRAQYRCGEGCP